MFFSWKYELTVLKTIIFIYKKRLTLSEERGAMNDERGTNNDRLAETRK